LRQSDAVFAHIKNIPTVSEKLKLDSSDFSPLAIGCSDKPRNVEDSYMPCFLAGVAAANFAATVKGVPLYCFSHQEGHVMAALYSAGLTERFDGRKFGAFHVSGGTSELLLIDYNSKRKDDDILKIELVGQSDDLNAGQAVDRVGVMMGFDFPCGAMMEKCVFEHEGILDIPRANISVKGLKCNLSGLQNKAEKLYSQNSDRAVVSAFVFDFIGRTLMKMTENFRAEYGDLPVLYAGGVMSNKYIKKQLSVMENVYFAEPQFSADNAAGIAYLTYLTANK